MVWKESLAIYWVPYHGKTDKQKCRFSALWISTAVLSIKPINTKYISLTRPSSILTQSVQPSETQEVLYIYSHSVCVQISCKHCYNTLGVDEIVIITLQINDLITIVKIVVFFPNGKDDWLKVINSVVLILLLYWIFKTRLSSKPNLG